jgi:glutaredoxin
MDSSEHYVGSLNHEPQVSRIVVYTSSGCTRCAMLKEWLKSREREFEEKDLENVDVMADLVMRDAVILSAPALEIEETFFREDEIFDTNGRLNGKLLHILEGK